MKTLESSYITNEIINPEEALKKIQKTSSGALVVFMGLVRDHIPIRENSIKEVKKLEYSAFEPLANHIIQKIIEEGIQKFKLKDAYVRHRIGILNLEEIAVIVVTSSAHRKECYLGNQYIIDRIKYEAPIWKKEYFADGTTEWSKGYIPTPNES
ncbi:MAG: molybdenum cofactor biosynthesis protein MoaE [Leptonema sp. (in: bacteria)]